MKCFQVPADVTVTPWGSALANNPNAKPETLTFITYALTVWLVDRRAYAQDQSFSLIKQKRWLAVIGKFQAAKVGDWIVLEDEDYAMLKTIVDKPANSMSMATTMAAIPFSDAVLAAVDKVPE